MSDPSSKVCRYCESYGNLNTGCLEKNMSLFVWNPLNTELLKFDTAIEYPEREAEYLYNWMINSLPSCTYNKFCELIKKDIIKYFFSKEEKDSLKQEEYLEWQLR